IAGTISLTSVSVYIVDLKRVQPIASCMDEAAKHHISKQTAIVHSPSCLTNVIMDNAMELAPKCIGDIPSIGQYPNTGDKLASCHGKSIKDCLSLSAISCGKAVILKVHKRHLQNMLNAGGQVHPEMSEAEAMSSIIKGHQSMMTVLQHRCKNLHIVFAQWSSKDAKTALDTAVSMNDTSVIVDVLNVISLRPQLWTLDMCQVVLPTVYDLLQNRFETYMSAGCSCLKLILKNFASLINSNIAAPPGVGVDISREERYNKCVSCYHQLLSIRAFLLKRQTLSGKLGQSFRELQLLMQRLD
ncbi:katanin p80 WD40 repeat-containing subunit B1-like, partial [Limulus polyphemus]|uniref:Katanin p80 WD40 repeat-containing subunit B1-like n=1 Tax=Limulus polyphemus TaxID=6850 RepID=A0ABM1SU20_LIMPO